MNPLCIDNIITAKESTPISVYILWDGPCVCFWDGVGKTDLLYMEIRPQVRFSNGEQRIECHTFHPTV